MTRALLVTFLVAAAAVTACETEAEIGERNPPQQDDPVVPPAGPLQLDILFVIDNSMSMTDDQVALSGALQHFLDELERLPGGLPDLHIGVVSSNVGIAPFATTGCSGSGDDGVLQNLPRGACSPPTDRWIADAPASHGRRTGNHQGSIVDAFACIARLGSTGCGFEQHLEAMKRALDGHRPENDGFLRPGAFLTVVFIADEDDCSADGEMFDTTQNLLTDPLGPFGSFRCTEFGVVCDAHTIARADADYRSCVPRSGSYVRHPSQYASFLRSIKPDDRIFLAALVGDATPFHVEMDSEGNPELGASCSGPTTTRATPGIRFRWLLDQFPHDSLLASICSDDFAVPLTAAGVTVRQSIAEALGRQF